jgi:uncharacterized protein YkwD
VLHTKYFVGGLLVAASSIAISNFGVVVDAIGYLDGATVDTRAVRVDPPRSAPVTPGVSDVRPMVDLVNAERRRAGLAPVAWDDRVAAAALAHSTDMAAMRRMTHTGSDGSNAGDRLLRAGFQWRSWGENVAAGYNSNESAFAAWMNSPDHRRQILGNFTMIGIAAVGASGGPVYWTMDLATAR